MRFVFVAQAARTAGVLPLAGTNFVVGVNPPWNQAHETPFALNKSPTFLLLLSIPIRSPPLQSSNAGSGSPMTLLAVTPLSVVVITSPAAIAPTSVAGSAPPVMPEITLIAPGVDGPNTVSNELSLIAKCCA